MTATKLAVLAGALIAAPAFAQTNVEVPPGTTTTVQSQPQQPPRARTNRLDGRHLPLLDGDDGMGVEHGAQQCLSAPDASIAPQLFQ